jgi:hypothetical protein
MRRRRTRTRPEPVSEESKAKTADVVVIVPLGPEVMAVSGGVVSGGGGGAVSPAVKLAPTDRPAVIVTLHDPDPLQLPDQLLNADPWDGVSVAVTVVP